MKTILITGSGGLVGFNVARTFHFLGWRVVGIDNNMRGTIFGPNGDVLDQIRVLINECQNYEHHSIDIRDNLELVKIFKNNKIDAIVHAAGQPSHDAAASIPTDDLFINVIGTFNLLEFTRKYCPESPFIFLSTNKVYGDNPNQLVNMIETDFRYKIVDDAFPNGIHERLSIDQSTHSLFGVSKTSADLYVQEYGKYFGIPTCCLRAGCITGSEQSGVQLHGFLNYLIRTNLKGETYNIYGYGGKQVRDNIHPIDIAWFIKLFIERPKYGEVYNIGGGYHNSCSILEAIIMLDEYSANKTKFRQLDEPRIGDHICYYTDLSKIRKDYPGFRISEELDAIIVTTIEKLRANS